MSKGGLRNALEDVTGGTMGGIALTLVGHPLDTVKVRLQTQPHDKPVYSGVIDCFRKTIHKEGFFGLYRGVSSPLAGQAVLNGWQFFVYGLTQKMFAHPSKPDERLSIPQFFAVGAVTGAAIALVESPQDFFKSQLQVQIFKEKPIFSSLGQCVSHIYRLNGVVGLYQGLGATVIRNIPSVSLYFGVYEHARNVMTPPGKTVKDLSVPQLLSAGAISGLFYWNVTYPLDVIKSAIQGDDLVKSQRKYHGIVDAAGKLWKEGGARRFYRGYAPCLLRAIPANAACFFGYEKTREFLSQF